MVCECFAPAGMLPKSSHRAAQNGDFAVDSLSERMDVHVEDVSRSKASEG